MQSLKDRFQMAAKVPSQRWLIGPWRLLKHVGGLRQLHLDRVPAIQRASVVACRPAAFEATIGSRAKPLGVCTDVADRLLNCAVAGGAEVRANIEIWQCTIKQERDVRAD